MEPMIKDGKVITAISAANIRQLITKANNLNVKREDIVSLVKENGSFILVYYRDGGAD